MNVEDFIAYLKNQYPERDDLSWEGYFLP